MVMLSGSGDILGAVVVPGGGYGAWPELAGRVEQRAAQVLEQAQAVGRHGQAAPAAGGLVKDGPGFDRCALLAIVFRDDAVQRPPSLSTGSRISPDRCPACGCP